MTGDERRDGILVNETGHWQMGDRRRVHETVGSCTRQETGDGYSKQETVTWLLQPTFCPLPPPHDETMVFYFISLATSVVEVEVSIDSARYGIYFFLNKKTYAVTNLPNCVDICCKSLVFPQFLSCEELGMTGGYRVSDSVSDPYSFESGSVTLARFQLQHQF